MRIEFTLTVELEDEDYPNTGEAIDEAYEELYKRGIKQECLNKMDVYVDGSLEYYGEE